MAEGAEPEPAPAHPSPGSVRPPCRPERTAPLEAPASVPPLTTRALVATLLAFAALVGLAGARAGPVTEGSPEALWRALADGVKFPYAGVRRIGHRLVYYDGSVARARAVPLTVAERGLRTGLQEVSNELAVWSDHGARELAETVAAWSQRPAEEQGALALIEAVAALGTLVPPSPFSSVPLEGERDEVRERRFASWEAVSRDFGRVLALEVALLTALLLLALWGWWRGATGWRRDAYPVAALLAGYLPVAAGYADGILPLSGIGGPYTRLMAIGPPFGLFLWTLLYVAYFASISIMSVHGRPSRASRRLGDQLLPSLVLTLWGTVCTVGLLASLGRAYPELRGWVATIHPWSPPELSVPASAAAFWCVAVLALQLYLRRHRPPAGAAPSSEGAPPNPRGEGASPR